ncbi:ABC transporter substrate-binding protein [Nocardioides sp.]|uniref:ABC transporter substrate-binding protein n=1 Tax=Nocardioides sp. TaxID=35761 RepID=UPI003D14CA51
MRLKPLLLLAPLALSVLACAPQDEAETVTEADSCATADLPVLLPGSLTVATDSPAYEPWFVDNKPANGQGFESAVAYAVADQLGFDKNDVTWVKVPFNNSYAPGEKRFDFDINQISITPARQKVVDFSDGYYSAAQAVITLKKDAAAASTLSALKDLKLGAQTGTTSLTAIRDDIQPTSEPLVFPNTNVAKQALLNGQVDAIVADLPTAFYITAVEIPEGTITGQFPTGGAPEEFGLLMQKGSELLPCINEAVQALKDDGTLAELEQKWLSDVVDVPVLQ